MRKFPTRDALTLLAVVLVLWLTRGAALDRYVTIDESKWVIRSGNFYHALATGQLEYTFQRAHPGVTVMWAGAAGYLLRFPEYASEVPGQFERINSALDDFLRANGHEPLEILVAGRAVVLLINTLVLGGAFLFARRLLSYWPALVGTALILFDPFAAAHSRFLHPDSLLSGFMLLSLLAFLDFLLRGRKPLPLVISGVAAGLALLTKTPAIFLLPLVGLCSLLVTLSEFYGARQAVEPKSVTSWPGWLRRLFAPLLGWLAIAALLCLLLWPSLWVQPVETFARMLDVNAEYAEDGHTSPTFFDGEILLGDPGPLFYPRTYLWRSTPTTLLGLLLVLVATAARWPLLRERRVRLVALLLGLHAIFFVIFMNLGAKKFDRYLLPVYMPLDLLAGIGWASAAFWILNFGWRNAAWQTMLLPKSKIRNLNWVAVLLIIPIALQAFPSLATFPYYLSYYNPLLGGAARAPDVMQIGWGEGLDQAARYLNEELDEATRDEATVASWYLLGPFNYIYSGRAENISRFWQADYSVLYRQQQQRLRPSRRFVAHFEEMTPLQTFTLNGIDYASLYDTREQTAEFLVQWRDALQLVHYELFAGEFVAGETYDLVLEVLKRAPLDENLNWIVQIVHENGFVLLREEGFPNGEATGELPLDALIEAGLRIRVPLDAPTGLYRIELSFYSPQTLDRLPVTSVATGALLAEPYVLDYLVIGETALEANQPLDPAAELGDAIQLVGVDFLAENDEVAAERTSYQPGGSVRVRLHWRATDFVHADYTGFVHLVDAEGLIAQHDQPPLAGFLPTSYWSPGLALADDYAIGIPVDTPPGEYALHAGLYDLDTLERLPITRGGEPVGDSFVVATLTVE